MHHSCTGKAAVTAASESLQPLSASVFPSRYVYGEVQITGLKSKPQLNGSSGILLDYHPSSDRYDVVTATGKTLALKPSCLSLQARFCDAQDRFYVLSASGSARVNGIYCPQPIAGYGGVQGYVLKGKPQVRETYIRFLINCIRVWAGGARNPCTAMTVNTASFSSCGLCGWCMMCEVVEASCLLLQWAKGQSGACEDTIVCTFLQASPAASRVSPRQLISCAFLN